jgi:hypothetical protein
MAILPQYTPAISTGNLVIDLNGEGDSTHIVTLNATVSSGGISFTNPPASGFTRVRVVFNQVTPSGTLYDVPVDAWSGAYTMTWDSDYAIWQSATPSIVQLQSWDQMTTVRGVMNAQAGSVVLAVTEIPAVPDVDVVYVKYTA